MRHQHQSFQQNTCFRRSKVRTHCGKETPLSQLASKEGHQVSTSRAKCGASFLPAGPKGGCYLGNRNRGTHAKCWWGKKLRSQEKQQAKPLGVLVLLTELDSPRGGGLFPCQPLGEPENTFTVLF